MQINRTTNKMQMSNHLSVLGYKKPLVVLSICLIVLPVIVFLVGGRSVSPIVWLRGTACDVVCQGYDNLTLDAVRQEEKEMIPIEQGDKLLGGLLSPRFDDASCRSRYRSAFFRKSSPHSVSSYLISKLRKYEELHAKCAPNTLLYQKSIEQLKSGHNMESMECNYVVWTPLHGLGNRMLTLVSAFLYAILTERVLLIDETKGMTGLFCEPFPETSWILPSNFPIKNLDRLDRGSEVSYGNMIKNKKLNNSDAESRSESLPSYTYLHITGDYQHFDHLFYCDEDQTLLSKINWLVFRSDLYFVPNFFLISQFEDELGRMFPSKEMIFHHLGRYLFHPTNRVWGMITKYYFAHMANSDEKIGLQIRMFPWQPISKENYLKQILACSQQEKILPELVDLNSTSIPTNNKTRSISVLITSLYSEYLEKLQTMYSERKTENGETISFIQPTQESRQRTRDKSHNEKALMEMFLMSYTDILVTTGWSTFGYMGQGLGGLKPWILLTPYNKKPAEPPCTRAFSMEPCNHKPPTYNCRLKREGDVGSISRHVRHCEDVGYGVKLVD